MSYGQCSVACIYGLALACAPRAGQPISAPAPTDVTAQVSMVAVIPEEGPSWALVRADGSPGRLTIAGALRVPETCGHLEATMSAPAPAVLDVRLTRVPPGLDSVCLGTVGMYRFIAVVGPLARAPYELRARYVHRRPDGTHQLDALLADTILRVP